MTDQKKPILEDKKEDRKKEESRKKSGVRVCRARAVVPTPATRAGAPPTVFAELGVCLAWLKLPG